MPKDREAGNQFIDSDISPKTSNKKPPIPSTKLKSDEKTKSPPKSPKKRTGGRSP